MNINTAIVDAYLRAEDMHKFSTMWLYVGQNEMGEKNLFHAPSQSEAKRERVAQIKAVIFNHAKSFTPCNAQVWDALFDDWHLFLKSTTLDLIVGYTESKDAIAMKAPDGSHHVIFDLLCWEKYTGAISVSALSQNLLTHELFHVMSVTASLI